MYIVQCILFIILVQAVVSLNRSENFANNETPTKIVDDNQAKKIAKINEKRTREILWN